MEQYCFSTEERAALEGLRQPFAIYQLIDGQPVTLLLSDGYCRLYGYADRKQAMYSMDHGMYKTVHPDDRARLSRAALRFFEHGEETLDIVFRIMTGEGSDYHMIHAHGIHMEKQEGIQLLQVWYMDEGIYVEDSRSTENNWMSRILNNALHEESILQAASYDELTGLPNLSCFFKLCETRKARLRREGRVAVLLYLDLDGMKYFNHKNGFAEGDRLLKAFALILARIFGKENCCHIGADRFAANTTEEILDRQLNLLFTEARQANAGKTLPVRAGIYSTGMEDVPVSTAYDRAKMACDAIRASGVSAFGMYDRKLRDAVRRHQYLVENIDRAIAEKWITVYYQPIVRAVNEKVCDEEALARWIDPVEGFMAPEDFVPQLEQAGLIYKLDLYVLEQVLEKMLAMKERGIHIVPHSINLSRSDFDACDIVEEFRKRVDAAGVSRDLITIEITESVIGSDFDFMKEQVGRFRELGFQVWMDDFGSGYSSLHLLQNITFDLIKFDMSFMQTQDEGENGKIILTEMMKMATLLGVDTVCEGVETEEQVRFLQEIGCSKLQGFHYSKPVPLRQIVERSALGIEIGFEDPEAASYYETIGRVNLYDISVITSMEEDSFQHAFSTLPMGIVEIQGDIARFVRSNPSYREFMKRTFGIDMSTMTRGFFKYSAAFMQHIRKVCCEQGGRAFYNEKMPDGSVVHSFARRIGVNPVTGDTAVAIAIFSITEPDGKGTEQQERIERIRLERNALAKIMAATEDYISLYSVDPETGEYVEYTSTAEYEALGFEKEGGDFFFQWIENGKKTVYPEDLQKFLDGFSRESVLEAVRKDGAYALHYRMMMEGKPQFVSLKITTFPDGRNEKLLAGVRKWRIRN